MGWFWADPDVSVVNARGAPHPLTPTENASPPLSCPMHKSSAPKPIPAPESACPYTPADLSNTGSDSKHASKYSKYNPLNYMFSDLSQDQAKDQTLRLPTEREPSTIPKGGSGQGNWEYPSPQQMYNALLRKGFTDTDVSAVESMVSVHNFLNEGAWGEIVEWERRFSRGLAQGWEICKQGEGASMAGADILYDDGLPQPKLIRFMGRPKEMTPKAAMLQVMGWIYPSKFERDPPFDRHDWFVEREHAGKKTEVRYVIDYYSAPDDPEGEPVFYLDVRPAVTPTATVERSLRWWGDVWYRASGKIVRDEAKGKS